MTTQADPGKQEPAKADEGAKADAAKSSGQFSQEDYTAKVSENTRLTSLATGLQEQLTQADETRKQHEARIKELEAGLNSKSKGNSKENNSEDVEKRIREEFAPKLTEKDQKIEQLESIVKTYEVTNKVMALAETRLNDDAKVIYKELVKKYFDKDRGNPNALVVLDDNGKKRYSPINPALPMSPEEWWDERAKLNPSSFKATAVTSGSMQTTSNNMKSTTVTDPALGRFQGMTREQYKQVRPTLDRATAVKADKIVGL